MGANKNSRSSSIKASFVSVAHLLNWLKAVHALFQVDEESSALFVEAFEHMLEAWVSVLHESQSFPQGFCQQSAIEIFNTYVQVRPGQWRVRFEELLDLFYLAAEMFLI